MANRSFEVIEERSGEAPRRGEVFDEDRIGRIVALGLALSDPIRVRLLGMMAEGRSCCGLTDLGTPAEDEDKGICVCEFEDYFGMGQSRVSYHVGKLREAGLVYEERRGMWSFYSLDRDAARELLADAKELLSA